jgi:hypothetical protein
LGRRPVSGNGLALARADGRFEVPLPGHPRHAQARERGWSPVESVIPPPPSPKQALSFFKRQGFGQAVRHVYLSRNLDDHPRAIERRFDGETEDEG